MIKDLKEVKAEKGHSEGCKEVQRARIFQAEGRESRCWVQNKPWREQYDRAEVRREASQEEDHIGSCPARQASRRTSDSHLSKVISGCWVFEQIVTLQTDLERIIPLLCCK